MAKAYVLSESDVALLRELAQRERSRRPIPPHSSRPEDPGAPDVYIARTPYGGIPALIEASGTSERDQPGYADCTIYRIIGEEDAARLHPVNDSLSKTVYNINLERIGGNRWISVKRDKFGRWVVDVPAPAPDVDNDTGTGTDGISESDLHPVFNDTGTGTNPETGGPGGLWTGGPGPDYLPGGYYPCAAVPIVETDIFCEAGGSFTLSTSGGLGTGTGTDLLPTNYYLNLYKRVVMMGLNRFTGCLESVPLAWEFVRTIGCCEPECTEPDIGTGSAADNDCCTNGSLYHRVGYTLNGHVGPTLPSCTTCSLAGYLYETDLGSGTYHNDLGGSTCGGRSFLDLTLYCAGTGWRAKGSLRRYLPFIQDTTQTFDIALTSLSTTTLQGTIPVTGCSDMTLLITNPCYSYNCTTAGCVEIGGDGGTYATLSECEAGCTISACSCDMPININVSISDFLGTSCLDGVSLVISYNGVDSWVGTTTACAGNTITVTLFCSGGVTWQATLDCDGTFHTNGILTFNCDPLLATFRVAASGNCGTWDVVMTMTE